MTRKNKEKATGTIRKVHWTVLNRAVLFLVVCLSMPSLSFAQKEKASYISVGATSILDTYLSQETAHGIELRYSWDKANRKDGHHWSSYVSQDAFLSKAGTRGNENSFIGAMYNLRFGWHYNFDFAAGGVNSKVNTSAETPLNLRVGLLADLSLGGLYNTRNSNNPAQARASLFIDPAIKLSWRFHISGKPFALKYKAAVPTIGLAFSPNYGQSYYEIFTRGNYDHNVVFLSPFSGIQLHQMLTLDFQLWHTTFTVGYLGDIRQMDANSLKYHQYSHNFVIGWRY